MQAMTVLRHYYHSSDGHCWILARVASVICYYVFGVYFYHITENWTILDSIYFVTVSVSTVGYGDYHPSTDTGRLFTIVFIILGFILVLSAVDELAKYGVIPFQNYVINGAFVATTHLERAKWKLVLTLSILVFFAVTGVSYFTASEGWSGIQAFYYITCTMTTVGYGDVTPKEPSTRVFTITFIALCVVMYATLMHNVREYYRYATISLVRGSAGSTRVVTREGAEQGEGECAIEGDIEMNRQHSASLDSTNSDEFVSLFPITADVDGVTHSPLMSPNNAAGPPSPTGKVTRQGFMQLPTSEPYESIFEMFAFNDKGGANSIPNGVASDSPYESNGGTTGSSSSSGSEREIDATVHLLAALERINAHNPMAAEFAAMRNKYELTVPQDERVRCSLQVRKPRPSASSGSSSGGIGIVRALLPMWALYAADQLSLVLRVCASRLWRAISCCRETQQRKTRSV